MCFDVSENIAKTFITNGRSEHIPRCVRRIRWILHQRCQPKLMQKQHALMTFMSHLCSLIRFIQNTIIKYFCKFSFFQQIYNQRDKHRGKAKKRHTSFWWHLWLGEVMRSRQLGRHMRSLCWRGMTCWRPWMMEGQRRPGARKRSINEMESEVCWSS